MKIKLDIIEIKSTIKLLEYNDKDNDNDNDKDEDKDNDKF